MKPANTFSVMWPASMFANSRTLCEIGRDRNDIISISTIKRHDVDRNAARHEQPEESDAVLVEAVADHREEDEQRKQCGDDDVARDREKSGDHAEHVQDENETEQREHEREEAHAFFARRLPHHVGNELVGHLGDRLHAARHKRTAARSRDQQPPMIRATAANMNAAELVKAISMPPIGRA